MNQKNCYSYNLSFSNAIVFAGYEVHTTIVITTDFRLSDYHLPVARIGQHWQSVAAKAGLSTAHSSAPPSGLLAPPSGGARPPNKKDHVRQFLRCMFAVWQKNCCMLSHNWEWLLRCPLYALPQTTDARWGNCLHCTAENQLPLPNFKVRTKHILSATSAQIFRFLWFMPSLGVRSPC